MARFEEDKVAYVLFLEDSYGIAGSFMVSRMVRCRAPGTENELECPTIREKRHSNPIADRVRRKHQGFILASSSKTPRVQVVFLGNFGAEAFPIN